MKVVHIKCVTLITHDGQTLYTPLNKKAAIQLLEHGIFNFPFTGEVLTTASDIVSNTLGHRIAVDETPCHEIVSQLRDYIIHDTTYNGVEFSELGWETNKGQTRKPLPQGQFYLVAPDKEYYDQALVKSREIEPSYDTFQRNYLSNLLKNLTDLLGRYSMSPIYTMNDDREKSSDPIFVKVHRIQYSNGVSVNRYMNFMAKEEEVNEVKIVLSHGGVDGIADRILNVSQTSDKSVVFSINNGRTDELRRVDFEFALTASHLSNSAKSFEIIRMIMKAVGNTESQ